MRGLRYVEQLANTRGYTRANMHCYIPRKIFTANTERISCWNEYFECVTVAPANNKYSDIFRDLTGFFFVLFVCLSNGFENAFAQVILRRAQMR